MLIKINILEAKDIDLSVSIRSNHINNYRIIFELTITSPSRPFIK